MKILMLTPYLPYPPSSGGQVRSYNLIKNLSKHHQITLYSLIKNEKERVYVSELEKYCEKVKIFSRPAKAWTIKNIFKTIFSLYPFLVIRNYSEEEKKSLEKEQLENFDLIHAETFYVMPHIPQTTTPILLVDQTIEFQVYQHFVKNTKKWFLKPFLYIDILKIKYWELKFWRKADKVVAVSESDKRKMLELDKKLNIGVVPNGAGEDLMNVWDKRLPQKTPTILFQANFLWLQNIEAAEILAKKVFPAVKNKIPDVICWISGQNANNKIGYLRGSGVEVIDLDNFDINGVIDIYRKAGVFVAPLEGPGGTRLKILGAMAAGVPVVTSRIGIEGIDAEDGRQVLIADNLDEMANKTIDLFLNKDKVKQLVKEARKLVEEKYSYESVTGILDSYYKEASGGKN